ncbi:hypothetical protein [Parvibaculum sp.]|uniref:hypothetical protein n=1 Tax=Parvibaculum sp. TaxID=2024848 RepID=UPI00391D9DD8
MSDEPWFPDREVAIVLTGEEWFVILAKLADPDSLTERGVEVYAAAAIKFAAQLNAEGAL